MQAFICDGVRTPIGRYGGALSSIRADDLAAIPIRALIERNPDVDWTRVDEVVFGAANQAGEDNRNVGRMAALLAGLSPSVPGITVNRLCASGMDAVGMAARAIRAGDQHLTIAGGVESMSRAPFVIPKAASAFDRGATIYDTTIGWRFPNPAMHSLYGTDSMPQTADNVAQVFDISRADQDAFALRSQERWAQAHERGIFADEIVPVSVTEGKAAAVTIEVDEHPRATSLERLGNLKGVNSSSHGVTAGNASGVNDGAAAMIVASQEAVAGQGLEPLARIVAMASAGVEPRVMGVGPVPAVRKLLAATRVSIGDIDVIELNEAFASQALATLRALGVADDAPHVNANGGAIAMGHPLGMSGSRLVLTAARQLQRGGGRYALCTMCVGVGQGTAILLERM